MQWSVIGIVMFCYSSVHDDTNVFSFRQNVASNNRPYEDRVDIPLPVGNNAAQLQAYPQHLQYVDVDYYNIANDYPPLHEHRNHATSINNYAGAALDVPAQPQAAPSDPVYTDLTSPCTHINQSFAGGD